MQITISGGTVESKINGGTAIYVNRGTVEVSGGTVEANGDGGRAIFAGHGVEVSGGIVEANGDGGTAILSFGNIEVSDGAVSAGNGIAIHGTAPITINGGTISATSGRAINAGVNSTVSVKGGLVFAYGSEIATNYTTLISPDTDAVIYMLEGRGGEQGKLNNPTGNGVVVAWDTAKGTRAYTAGTTIDLTMDPAGAAEWGIDGNNGGIRYGANNFFIIPGITINTP